MESGIWFIIPVQTSHVYDLNKNIVNELGKNDKCKNRLFDADVGAYI